MFWTYVQNNKIKRLTSKSLEKYFISLTLLFLFLAYEFSNTWNYLADRNTHVCLCIPAILDFILMINEWWNLTRADTLSQMEWVQLVQLHKVLDTCRQPSVKTLPKFYSQITFQECDLNAVLQDFLSAIHHLTF